MQMYYSEIHSIVDSTTDNSNQWSPLQHCGPQIINVICVDVGDRTLELML